MSDDRTPPRGRLREHVAEEIRVLLARRRMSATELARRTGIKQSTMSRRMTGETAFDMDDLEVIAQVLGVEVADLMPRTARIGGDQTAVKPTPAARMTPNELPPLPGGPFGGGRRDTTRPISAIPASRRRPQVVRSAKRPKTA